MWAFAAARNVRTSDTYKQNALFEKQFDLDGKEALVAVVTPWRARAGLLTLQLSTVKSNINSALD